MLSSFLIELAQVDASMLNYSYSMQSTAALYVAMRTFGECCSFCEQKELVALRLCVMAHIRLCVMAHVLGL
jgi:hypothetical protein